MYECDPSCYDYNNGHLCKHIHRIQSLVNSNCKPEINDMSSVDMDVDLLEYAGSVLPPQQGILIPHANFMPVSFSLHYRLHIEVKHL